jgi:hypothetical protein
MQPPGGVCYAELCQEFSVRVLNVVFFITYITRYLGPLRQAFILFNHVSGYTAGFGRFWMSSSSRIRLFRPDNRWISEVIKLYWKDVRVKSDTREWIKSVRFFFDSTGVVCGAFSKRRDVAML